MRKIISIILTSILCLTGFLKAPAQDRYQVYVVNDSKFDISCVGMPEKGEGVFTKYTPLIKSGQRFLFGIERLKKTLPHGVEGTITFRLPDPKYTGTVKLYFNNPVIGSDEFKIINSEWPFTAAVVPADELHENTPLFVTPYTIVRLSVDTAHYGTSGGGIKVSGGSQTKQNMDEPIPPVINFDWEVVQRLRNEDEGGYKTPRYYFTANGDYAAIIPPPEEEKSFTMMIYSKKGHTWMVDDKKKTITVMNMPKTVGEGGEMGKAYAEKIKKAPLTKDNDDEQFTIKKTGKTKKILGYTADEYEMRNTSKTGTASSWYARVPFDPIKIYTMGVGRPADVSSIQNNPKMKNNIFSIPMLNANYLWVETEAGGIKGMETLKIEHVNHTVYTAGYKIKVLGSLKDMRGDDDN